MRPTLIAAVGLAAGFALCRSAVSADDIYEPPVAPIASVQNPRPESAPPAVAYGVATPSNVSTSVTYQSHPSYSGIASATAPTDDQLPVINVSVPGGEAPGAAPMEPQQPRQPEVAIRPVISMGGFASTQAPTRILQQASAAGGSPEPGMNGGTAGVRLAPASVAGYASSAFGPSRFSSRLPVSLSEQNAFDSGSNF